MVCGSHFLDETCTQFVDADFGQLSHYLITNFQLVIAFDFKFDVSSFNLAESFSFRYS